LRGSGTVAAPDRASAHGSAGSENGRLSLTSDGAVSSTTERTFLPYNGSMSVPSEP
jgi:hypothetical protein